MSASVGVVMQRAAELAASRDRVRCLDCGKTRLLNHPCPNRRDAPRTQSRVKRQPPPPSRFYQWWLDQYTLEQIRELAAGFELFFSPDIPQRNEPTEDFPQEAPLDRLATQGA